MAEFLEKDFTMMKELIKLIEEQDFFEENSNYDFYYFQVHVLTFILSLHFFC